MFMPAPFVGVHSLRVSIAADTTNYNLFTALGSPANRKNVKVTIETGVYVYATAIGTPGFDVGAGWAAGSKLTIINNGFILGKGGKGAHWNGSGLNAAENGGDALALRANISTSVDNLNGAICGGGGGGGGVYGTKDFGSGPEPVVAGGGGAAGGGDGGSSHNISGTRAGGAGGGPAAAGSNGIFGTSNTSGAGGGGRIVPGSGGPGSTFGVAATGGGSGGGGGSARGGNGGGGGSADATGSNGTANLVVAGGGGGGWGAAGGNSAAGAGVTVNTTRAPGSGGKCVALNGQTIIWLNNGTQYGAIL